MNGQVSITVVKTNMAKIPKDPVTLSERKELAKFLTENGSMPIYTLHGFLCAVASHSNVITPEQWLPEIYQETMEDQSAKEVESKLDLVFRLYNQILTELREKQYFNPLVNINEYGRQITLDDSSSLSYWCEGYFMALTAFESTWDFDEEGPLGALIMSLMAFAPQEMLEEISATEEGRKDMQDLQAAREDIITELPTLISFAFFCNILDADEADAREGQIPTPAFDAAQVCPCDSGEPFIACCGRVERSLH